MATRQQGNTAYRATAQSIALAKWCAAQERRAIEEETGLRIRDERVSVAAVTAFCPWCRYAAHADSVEMAYVRLDAHAAGAHQGVA